MNTPHLPTPATDRGTAMTGDAIAMRRSTSPVAAADRRAASFRDLCRPTPIADGSSALATYAARMRAVAPAF